MGKYKKLKKDKEEALLALLKRKGLTHKDLMLILGSVKIRSPKTVEFRKPYSNENVTVMLPECTADEIPVLIRKPYSDKITVSVARKASKRI